MRNLSIMNSLNYAVTRFTAFLLVFCLLALPLFFFFYSEAPLISMDRYADNTDTYAFRSLEPGREGFVTLIANYVPFQDPSGGPQFGRFDDTVLYEIKVDNTGDGFDDIVAIVIEPLSNPQFVLAGIAVAVTPFTITLKLQLKEITGVQLLQIAV
mgnify:CR=1 FL=1